MFGRLITKRLVEIRLNQKKTIPNHFPIYQWCDKHSLSRGGLPTWEIRAVPTVGVPAIVKKREKKNQKSSYIFLQHGVPWSYRGHTVERLNITVETLNFAVERPWFATPQKAVKIWKKQFKLVFPRICLFVYRLFQKKKSAGMACVSLTTKSLLGDSACLG